MGKLSKTAVPERTDKREVFLSYSLADGKIARLLCEKLESAGISVWYATRDLKPGAFVSSITKVIEQSRVFVIILSDASMRSSYVLNELEFAFQHKRIRILPILVDTENLSDDLRYYLSQMQFLDARNQTLEEMSDSVVKRVQDIINAQQESAS